MSGSAAVLGGRTRRAGAARRATSLTTSGYGPSIELDQALAELRPIAARHEGLRMLLLHGSRRRGRPHATSDWDLGFLAVDALDPARLHVDISHGLGTDDVDLVDLARASALLRFEAARHGRCIYGEHELVDRDLAARLARAAGFRNVVVHADADLDLARVHDAATTGTADLVAFLAAIRDHAQGTEQPE